MVEIRSYQGRDEVELLEVWHTAMTHDPISEDIFCSKVLLDPNFEAAHLPVAVVDGRVVGFVLGITRQVPFFLQGLEPEKAWITAFGVHPEFRRQGIGKKLFEHLLEQFSREGRKDIGISPYVPNYFAPGMDVKAYPETIKFLETLGFKTLYEAISMGADLTGFQIPPEILEREKYLHEKEGVTIKPVTAEDLPDLLPFIVKHFGWDWHRHARDYLLEYFSDSPHQVCFLVARQHGEVVGYCQQRRERFGPFGVNAEKRNLGIGRILLFRCLKEMGSKHNFYAYFLWTDENAARLYSLAGFKRRREFAVMQKVIGV